jgi:hypothetical protein
MSINPADKKPADEGFVDRAYIFSIVLVCGIVGGFSRFLAEYADPDALPWYRYPITGVIAALISYFFVTAGKYRLFAFCIVAGYVGQPIVDAAESRIKATIATRDAKTATEVASSAVQIGKDNVQREKNLQKIVAAFRKEGQKLPEGVKEEVIRAPDAIDVDATKLNDLAARVAPLEKIYGVK